jgi:hypothetical protein
VPDELFEELWSMKGGPELVALHAMFAGSRIPVSQVRDFLRLNPEGVRMAFDAAHGFGLFDMDDEEITFIAFPADSGQRARLDWCIEPHQAEFEPLVAKIRGQLLLRFLGSSPGQLS